jgi:hypothetical protein
MKLHQGDRGSTHLTIIERLLRVDCGCETPEAKVQAVRQYLDRDIERIEDLTVQESAMVSQKLIQFMYGGAR